MISNSNINTGSLLRCVCCYFLQNNVLKNNFFRVSFSDILNKQGLGKCYQPRLIYPDQILPILLTLRNFTVYRQNKVAKFSIVSTLLDSWSLS